MGKERQHGFTLVELMIATTVFSVVLLAVTSTVLHMTKQYQRSVYISRTQAVTADVSQSISTAIKYGKLGGGIGTSVVDNGDGSNTTLHCIGNREFLSVLGRRVVRADESVTKTTTRNALVTKKKESCTAARISDGYSMNDNGKQELLGSGMRLANLAIDKNGSMSMYVVTVRIVYGENDLLCSSAVRANSCDSGAAPLSEDEILSARDLKCRDGLGSEFCATSELKTIVESRL